MVNKTVDVVANIIAETNLGGGVAGAAYAMTAFADNEGDPMMAPFGGLTMPMKEVNREFIPEIGSDMGNVLVFDNGILVPEQTFPQYLQDDRWIDALILNLAQGSLPQNTFAIHYETGAISREAFGVYPIMWELDLKPKAFPRQNTTVRFYDSAVASVAAFTVDAGFKRTQPMVNNDISITIAAIGDLKWKSANIKIGVIYDDVPEIVAETVKYPYAKDLTLEMAITFVDYHASLLDIQDAIGSMTDHDVVIDLGTLTKDTLTMNDLIVKPESTNINSIPEKGLFEYSMSLVPGPNFDFADSDLTLV